MQLTDVEQKRVDVAVAKLPRTFVPLEGDAVPLGPDLLISSGTDLPSGRSTAVLFNDKGTFSIRLRVMNSSALNSPVAFQLRCRSPLLLMNAVGAGWWIGRMS